MTPRPIRPVTVGSVSVGGGRLVIIAGPCVLEAPDRVFRIARGLRAACEQEGVPLIFKASFDKANRTSGAAPRGPGIAQGLELLSEVRRSLGVPVTTDVHEPAQAERLAPHVDLLQVPAFLCRQTDLLRACGATGRPVNIKRGPFADPRSLGHAVDKVRAAGDGGVLLTERGTSFGHGDLVVDFRGLVWLRAHGVPVVFDATHSVQRPSAAGDRSGGDADLAPALARAAVAVGVDAVFVEVHDQPEVALSDAATQLPLSRFPALLQRLVAVREAVGEPGTDQSEFSGRPPASTGRHRGTDKDPVDA